MLFVRLDVNFQDDDKLIDVSSEAELLFLRSLALAKRVASEAKRDTCDGERAHSEGRIRAGHLRRLCDKLEQDPVKLASELVDAGLWAHENGDYVIVSWLKHNLSSGEIGSVRERKSAGGRLGNHRRHNHPGDVEDCSRCNRSDTDSDTESHSDRIPTRMRSVSQSPELEKELEKEKDPPKGPPARKRAAKRSLPDDWQPTGRHREIAAERGIDCETEAQRFRDSALAHDRRYADWHAAFRNWLTNDLQQPKRNSNGQSVHLTAAEQRTQRNRENRQRALAELEAGGLR